MSLLKQINAIKKLPFWTKLTRVKNYIYVLFILFSGCFQQIPAGSSTYKYFHKYEIKSKRPCIIVLNSKSITTLSANNDKLY